MSYDKIFHSNLLSNLITHIKLFTSRFGVDSNHDLIQEKVREKSRNEKEKTMKVGQEK